ncbi:MAG: hypothetical protein ACMZ64_12205 [Oleiphilus sp.]
MTFKSFCTLSVISASVLGIVGCGSGGSGDSQSNTPSTGQFIDGPVQGLSYRSNSYQGVTNFDGEFDFEPGEITVFSFADVVIGESAGASVVTPRNLSMTSSNPDRVLNVLRFLQTLDTDDDHSNGVQLPDPEAFTTVISSINFDQSEGAFDLDSGVIQFIDDAVSKTELIDSETALNNFEYAIEAAGVHPLEGRVFYRYENGNGSDFGLETALWCDTWYFSNGNFYQNTRTIDNLESCSDEVSTTPFFEYTINDEGVMIWSGDFEEGDTVPFFLLNDQEPYIYRLGGLEGDREHNRLYITKAEVESLLSSSEFDANGDRIEVTLTEISSDFYELSVAFPDRDCSVTESLYDVPEITNSAGARFNPLYEYIPSEMRSSAFVQNGDNCNVTTTISSPDDNTKYFVVVRGLDGIGLENLKASITLESME